MNENPLGAAALAGTSFPIDRHETAKALGFDRPTRNSLDTVADRIPSPKVAQEYRIRHIWHGDQDSKALLAAMRELQREIVRSKQAEESLQERRKEFALMGVEMRRKVKPVIELMEAMPTVEA